MAFIRVTPEELKKTSQSLVDISSTYKGIADRLMMNAETMGNAWSGEDNIAFVTQIKGFTEELELMSAKVKNAADIIATMGDNYANRQQDNIEQVKRLTN